MPRDSKLNDIITSLQNNDKTLTNVNLNAGSIDAEGIITLADALKRNQTLTQVALNGIGISAKVAKALAAALAKNHTLTQVNLRSNSIGDKGAKTLAAALAKNHTLTQVNLSSNRIGDEGAKALADALAINHTLTRVNLQDNSIGAEGAKALAGTLAKNHTLIEVDLYKNSIGAEGAKALAGALAINHTLNQVNLQDNSIGAEGAKALADALAINHTLNQVNLQNNNIGDEGAKALADALAKNRTLTQVNLNSNSIGVKGAKALADALAINHTLTQVNLGSNPIGDGGAKALADALAINHTLTQVNLGSNRIGDEGAKALADALAKNHSLTKVDLYKNSIGAEGAKALADALEKNQALTQFILAENKIGDEGAKALADALAKNQMLTFVNLSSNRISDKGFKALAAALEKNRTLTHVFLQNNSIDDKSKLALAKIEANVKANIVRALSLLEAANEGDFNRVQQLVKEGVAVNYRDNKGNTALDLAKTKNYTQIVNFLRAQQALLTNQSQLIANTISIPTTSQTSSIIIVQNHQPALSPLKVKWVKSLDLFYSLGNPVKQESHSQEETEYSTALQLLLPIPFSYANEDTRDIYRNEVYPPKERNKQDKKDIANIAVFTLVMGYKIYQGNSHTYHTYPHEFEGSAHIHVSTEYGVDKDNPINIQFLNDLYDYHPNDKQRIDSIAKNRIDFYQTFHHSERAMYKHIVDHIDEPLNALKTHLASKKIKPGSVKIKFMALDVLSTHYQCNWCQKAADYFQSPSSQFMTTLNENFKKDNSDIDNFIKPKRGVYFFHRYAAELPCKTHPLIFKDKHDAINKYRNINECIKQNINLILKQDNQQIYGSIVPVTQAHSRKDNIPLQTSVSTTTTLHRFFPSLASSSADAVSEPAAKKRKKDPAPKRPTV